MNIRVYCSSHQIDLLFLFLLLSIALLAKSTDRLIELGRPRDANFIYLSIALMCLFYLS
jgi:hypothetical protein